MCARRMGIPLHLYILAISLFHLLCTQRVNCDNSEIICSAWKEVRCTPSKNIRVHDVIYGHIVGRNECNTQPTNNCTAPNGFCEVAEKVEGRPVSEWLRSSDTISPPPCGGKDIYIIVNYTCVEILRLSGENFAFNKPAQQSKTTHGGVASRAVDGTKSRVYSSGSCTHTAEQTTPWWRVDLQQRITVTQVKIANRAILGDRLSGFEIRIGDNLENNGITSLRCGTQQHIPSNRWGTVWCDPTLIGRYVTIVIPGENKMLTLCEVEVYGIKEGENFAFNKPAQQSKTTHGGIASRAVDGNKNRYYSSSSCTHTAEQTTPWWRVDLRQRIAVTHVKIVNRDRIGKRLCGFEIRIGDSLESNGITSPRCGTQQHIPSNQEGIVSCVPTVVGRYVTIVIPGEKKTLTLCEVEVYGTKEDRGHAINICPTREVTASSGQIRSPNYPSNYPASTDCTLTIKQPLDTNFIFTFIMLDMESPFVDGCRYDELIISGSLSKKLCGTNTPAPFVIDVNVVTLRMVTDGSVEQSGFDLKFNTSRTTGLPPAVSVCPTRTITPRATGRVHSPGFAGNYGANLNCKLTLNVLSNKDVEISYNYRDIENASQCSKDKLTVADNSASNYTCGVSSAGNTTTYRDGNVSFLFSTDGSGSGSGFILTYKLLNKSPVSNQSTSAGQPTQPSSTTESTTKHSSTTDEIIQPFSTTKRNIQPFSTTGNTTQHFFTTESTILPSSTTDGNTQSSFTTEGTAQTSSTTDGTTQHSSTTEGTTLPSSSTEGTAQPSSTTENFRPVECLSVDSETEDKKIRMHLLIPLVILALCFLLSLAVIIYQSRRLQNSNRRASRRGILGGQELSNYMIMKGDSEAGDD